MLLSSLIGRFSVIAKMLRAQAYSHIVSLADGGRGVGFFLRCGLFFAAKFGEAFWKLSYPFQGIIEEVQIRASKRV